MSCPTTSGPYRCKHNANHTGDCESEDLPYVVRIGPYLDGFRARAYLRGRLDSVSGLLLTDLGARLGLPRLERESDDVYRERLWSRAK